MRRRLLEHVIKNITDVGNKIICCQNLTSFGDVTWSHRKPLCHEISQYVIWLKEEVCLTLEALSQWHLLGLPMVLQEKEKIWVVGSLYQYHIYISYYLTNNTKYKFFLSLFIQNNQMTGYYKIVLKNCMQSLFVHLLCTFFYILQMNNSFYRNDRTCASFISNLMEMYLIVVRTSS